jgi:hypothetical protein
MLGLLLWILLGLLLCLGVALALPWHLRFSGRTAPPEATAELRLLAGWAPAIPLKGPPERAQQPKRRRRPRSGAKIKTLRGVGALLKGILAAFGVQDLVLEGRFGLDDPADTGALYGMLQPIVALARAAGATIRVQPDFAGARLDLAGRGDLVIRPTRLVGALARFAWANRHAVLP